MKAKNMAEVDAIFSLHYMGVSSLCFSFEIQIFQRTSFKIKVKIDEKVLPFFT